MSESTMLAVAAAERDVALEETRAVLAAAADGAQRARLAALVGGLEDGAVPDEAVAELEQIVSLGLQSGRIRARYGPGGEQAALRLRRRLPGGIAGAEAARDVSQALEALRGRPLESIELAEVGPGAFSLSLAADGLRLSVRLDRQGARLHSLEL